MPYPSLEPKRLSPWDQALGAVRAYCRWHVAPMHTETLVLDGPGAASLILPTKMVQDIGAVKEEGEPVAVRYSQSGVVHKSNDGYSHRVSARQLYGVNSATDWWGSGLGSIEVTLSHGYDPDEVDDLLGIVAAVEARVRMDPSGSITSQRMGTQSVSTTTGGASALFRSERDALQKYRI